MSNITRPEQASQMQNLTSGTPNTHQVFANSLYLNTLPGLSRFKALLVFIVGFLSLVGSNMSAVAQRVPCAGLVTQVNAGAFTATLMDDLVVNADMLQHDTRGNTIKAIAYGRRYAPAPSGTGSADAYVYAEDWNGNNVTFQLFWPNAQKPDIVLASDDENHNRTGMNTSYKAIISYVSDSNLHYDIWRLDDCGLPTFNATLLFTSFSLNDSASGVHVDPYHSDPHIDMWSDGSGAVDPANGLPLMWDFAIVWSDGTRHWPTACSPAPIPAWPLWPITADDLKYVVSSANNTTTTPTTRRFGVTGYSPDVACLTDMSSGARYMEVVHAGPCGTINLSQFEWDPFATPPAMVGAPILLHTSGDAFFSPRIEAMSQDQGAGITWQVVTSQDNGGMVPRWQIWGYGYNKSTTTIYPTWISDMYTLATDSDSKAPCVAAGIGNFFSSDIGNTQYTPGFYPRTKDTIHDRSIDGTTGALDTRWWNVNCPPFPVLYHWDASRSMAVSNCSNSGFNLLTAWYDGSNIQYKESPNIMQFKQPTTVGMVNKGTRFTLFPSPAQTEVKLEGITAGSKYRVADIGGRILLTGIVPSSRTVEVQSLASGLYIFTVIDETNVVRNTKFSKH